MFDSFGKILILIACGAVGIILVWGLGTFGSGKDSHGIKSNKIMQYRIAAQGVAVVLIAIVFYMTKG